MKKFLSILFVSGIIFSCKQTSATSIVNAPVDSLIASWGNSWNHHDSAGGRNLFGDALLIDDDLIAHNPKEISAKWIHPNINVVSNLKSEKLQDWSANDRAGYTGTYEFDAVVNDSVVAKPKGVFTLNWAKTEKGDWKITTATIHSFKEKN
jgi:ketosteroid isomerase-like protein